MTRLGNVTEIVKDIVGIVYLHLLGVYTFIALPFRYLIPGKLKPLENEIILMVGISSSLSKEICRQLAKKKTKLILWDSTESLTDFTEDLKGEAEVFPYEVDLSDRTNVEAISNQVKREIGDVTIVINTMDSSPTASFLNQLPSQIESTFSFNLLSHFWISQLFLPKMLDKNHGHFVAIGSQIDSWGTGNCIPYISSKCGIRGFMQAMEEEVRLHMDDPDIKFTTVIPWFARSKTFSESGNGRKFRFPSLFPVLEDKYVATKIIQGFRRNMDLVYVPGCFGILLWFGRWVPQAFINKMESFFLLDLTRNSRHA